jgi:uracil-DNA glycosylase family 4
MGTLASCYNRSCKLCSLWESRPPKGRCLPGIGNVTDPSMVIVSDGPSMSEMDSRLGFTDQKAALLLEQMTEAGIPFGSDGDVYCTYACKCSSSGKIKISNARTCGETYLYRELLILKPRLILALGKTAQVILLGKTTPMSKTHGKLFDLTIEMDGEVLETQVMPIEHPFSVLSNPAKLDLWSADLRRAKAVLYGEGDPFWDDSKLGRFYFHVIKSEREFKQIAKRLIRNHQGSYLAIDIEASGLDVDMYKGKYKLDVDMYKGEYKVFTLQFGIVSVDNKELNDSLPVYILPIQSTYFDCIPLPRIVKMLNNFLHYRYFRLIAHNGKYDLKGLRTIGVNQTYLHWDTMMLWANAHGEAPMSLKEIAYQVTDLGGYEVQMEEYFKEHGTYDAPPEILVPYSGLDVVVTRHLMFEMENSILSSVPFGGDDDLAHMLFS